MNAKVDELAAMHRETIAVMRESNEVQRLGIESQRESNKTVLIAAENLDKQGQRIESYRNTIGPSLVGVAEYFKEGTANQIESSKILAKSIEQVVERMEKQEERHREEIKEERERQDTRDERHFSAMKELSNDVKENTKISLETSHQVTTLTQAVQDQCKALNSTQKDVKELQISMAVAKSKWAIIGTIGGIVGTALVGLIFKVWGGI